MNIRSVIITKILSAIDTAKNMLKVDRQIDLKNDIYTLRACLKCDKETRKIVERHCFQCYYDKSEVQH